VIFRLRFVQRGGHIHCRLFQAAAAGRTVRVYFADAPAVLEMLRRGDDPAYDVRTDPNR
jgi:hypothetical protein